MIDPNEAPEGCTAEKADEFVVCKGCAFYAPEKRVSCTCPDDATSCFKNGRKDGTMVRFVKRKPPETDLRQPLGAPATVGELRAMLAPIGDSVGFCGAPSMHTAWHNGVPYVEIDLECGTK